MHRSYATMFSTEQDIVSKCIVPMLQCFMQYDMTLSSTRTCTTRMTQWNDMTLLSVHALVVCHNGRNRTTWHCYQCMRYSYDTMVGTERTWHCCQCVHVPLVWHNGRNRMTWHCCQYMRYSYDNMFWTEYNPVISICATRMSQCSVQNDMTLMSVYTATRMTTCSEQSIALLPAHASLVCHNVLYGTTWHWCQCIQPLVWQHVLNRA